MLLLYDTVTPTPNNWAAASVGFEDGTGEHGLQISYNNIQWPPQQPYAVSIAKNCYNSATDSTTPSPSPEIDNVPVRRDPSCFDHDVELSGEGYCSAFTLSPAIALDHCSSSAAQLTGVTDAFGDCLLSEICPSSCGACAAQRTEIAIMRSTSCPAMQRRLCTIEEKISRNLNCHDGEECWLVGVLQEDALKSANSSEPFGICLCPQGMERDLCGKCALPQSAVNTSIPSGGVRLANQDMDCAGVCFGTARLDSCGSCVDGITGKADLAAVGCDGQCFTSKQCVPLKWSPIVLLASLICVASVTLVVLVSFCRRQLLWRMLATREQEASHNRRRHRLQTEELLTTLPTVCYDPEKDQVSELGGVTVDGVCCSICLGE